MKTCKSCWWQDGGLCYVKPCEREDNGRSKKHADTLCDSYWNKRKALGSVIPDNMLVITSELHNGKQI